MQQIVEEVEIGEFTCGLTRAICFQDDVPG